MRPDRCSLCGGGLNSDGDCTRCNKKDSSVLGAMAVIGGLGAGAYALATSIPTGYWAYFGYRVAKAVPAVIAYAAAPLTAGVSLTVAPVLNSLALAP